jgi:EF-P beta-lysylation protein EpmB
VDELWRLLGLPDDLLPAARRAAERFPLLVPRRFAALMRPGDVDDPLLRQVLPLADEFYESPGFSADPLDESGSSPVPGLLHKYQGRALLVVTGSCAVNCRFCFRRHFPYQELPYGPEWWRPAFDHLRRDPTLHEIILSGGDPLMLPDHQLALLAKEAADIPHIQRLRIHSRLPVVLPERVDEALLAWLTGSRLATVLVLHANHAREISAEVESACKRLRRAGVVLLNQSVLLAGVNDDAAVLAALSERLAACGVMPYYLHALDHVQGTAHFLVDDGQAKKLSEELSRLLPGWLVPRLVREVPGAPGKMPVP